MKNFEIESKLVIIDRETPINNLDAMSKRNSYNKNKMKMMISIFENLLTISFLKKQRE